MTEPWLEDEQVAAATCATVAKASPGLRTYSERRRHSRASADNSGDSTAVVFPYSAPNPSRPSYTQPFHPFFSHCSLQGPKPTQQKSSKRSFTQLHLDAGQANFACITCSICGLIYAKGEANDEKVHAAFHASYTQGIKFQGWQHERVLGWDGRQGRILLVLPTDATAHLKKVKEVCAVIEEDLGLCKGWLTATPCQVYLYVSSSKHVLGCVIAERITTAYPVVPALHTYASASTATSMPHLGTDSPPTPMAAPPFAKHQPLSCLGSAQSAASPVPLLGISQEETGSQRESSQAKLAAPSGLGLVSLQSVDHPRASIGSNSSSQAIVHLGSSCLHHRHPKRPNLLTRWLSTGKGKETIAQAAPSRSCASSPESAGSVAASGQAEGCSAASLRCKDYDSGSAVPIMPFTDITNDSSVGQSSVAEPIDDCHEGKGQRHGSSSSSLQQPAASDAEDLQAGQSACASQQPAGQCGSMDSMPQCSVADTVTGSDPAAGMDMQMSQDHDHFEDNSDKTIQIQSGADQMRLSNLGRTQAISEAGSIAGRLVPSAWQQTVTIDRIKPVKAACGIKVMWVSAHARRKRIATQLLDMARCNCVAGLVIPRSQLAFSQPTQSGRCLAEQFTQSCSFLVYQ